MSESPQEIIQRELSPTEKLLWAGRPRQGIIFRAYDVFAIPLSLIFCGFAIFFTVLAIVKGPPLGVLLGVPFLFVGLYGVIGRLFVEARYRARTTYGVTSERVLIIIGSDNRNIKSVNLATLTELTLSERRSGAGAIQFGSGLPQHWVGRGVNQEKTVVSPTFELSEGSREVFGLVLEARRILQQREQAHDTK